jgi:hypothetical protein
VRRVEERGETNQPPSAGRRVKRRARGDESNAEHAEDGFNAELAEIAESLPGKIWASSARSAFEIVSASSSRDARGTGGRGVSRGRRE